MRKINNLVILVIAGIVATSIAILFIEEPDKIKHQYSDWQIKKTAHEKTLTKKQIYLLLHRPVTISVNRYYKDFNCSKEDLKLSLVALICLETGNLQSKTMQINNLIGMKAVEDRPSFTFMTNEFINGEMNIYKQNFASFYSFEDCTNNFFKLLTKERYNNVHKAKNYKEFVKKLAKAGYATDPDYAEKVLRIIKNIKNN